MQGVPTYFTSLCSTFHLVEQRPYSLVPWGSRAGPPFGLIGDFFSLAFNLFSLGPIARDSPAGASKKCVATSCEIHCTLFYSGNSFFLAEASFLWTTVYVRVLVPCDRIRPEIRLIYPTRERRTRMTLIFLISRGLSQSQLRAHKLQQGKESLLSSFCILSSTSFSPICPLALFEDK